MLECCAVARALVTCTCSELHQFTCCCFALPWLCLVVQQLSVFVVACCTDARMCCYKVIVQSHVFPLHCTNVHVPAAIELLACFEHHFTSLAILPDNCADVNIE
jgi:hypothetical protein